MESLFSEVYVLEIMTHKNHGDEGELLPFNADKKDVQDEVNRRTAKAGYTTKYGENPCATKIQNHGFGESKLNIWPRDENGQLIDD